MTKDREQTEKKILEAVGKIVESNGFEAVGVNAVAAESGVSKVLIYRYFGSIDQLLAKYVEQNDFWLNYQFENIPSGDVKSFATGIFREYVNLLRNTPSLRRLYRWELTSQHPSIAILRQKREETALKIIETVCKASGEEFDHVAGISTLITASISYLCILAENCGVYNSLQIDSESGWEKIIETIDFMFNKLIK
ncbi:MAG: TetR/AcrR family transcriptional regulator [Bacteroidales bacterium]|nr:TetR/AcrR family transcriptional regulator [Bacteroidales bacterium]